MKPEKAILILIFPLLFASKLLGQEKLTYIDNHVVKNNKGLFRSDIGGFYDNGVVLSAIANRSDQTKGSAVCGFVDGLTASKYPSRDAASLYIENNNTVPIVVKGAVFNRDKVILPSNFDLSSIGIGDYIDVFHNGYTTTSNNTATRWTSIIDSIDYRNHTVKVKYGGFYKVKEGGTGEPEEPIPGSDVYFKILTKIWSMNSQVISRALKGTKLSGICGYELDVNNNIEGCYAQGMTVVSIGKVKGDIAYDVEGRWDAGYLARNPWVSFYSRDYGDGINKYVLRQDYMENGKNYIVGYIDKDFAYHQGNGFINLCGDDPCIQTTKGSVRFLKDGGIMIGGFSLWINEGKLYMKCGIPDNATDGRPFQENASGLFKNRPQDNVVIGEMYFCTDKSVPESDTEGIAIFYKGNDVWVDALGRIIR